jgi:hypothetical protein
MILLSLGVAVATPAALGAGTRVRVSPGRGGIGTTFVLRFTIPDATGTRGDAAVSDELDISGPGHAGCLGSANVPLRSAPADTAFKVALDPKHLNGDWCPGAFAGSLVERQTSVCPPLPVRARIVCPLYVVAPRVIGRFRFTVTRPTKTHTADHAPAHRDA